MAPASKGQTHAGLVWSLIVKTLSVGVQIKSTFNKTGWWPAGDKSFWGLRQPCSLPCTPYTMFQQPSPHLHFATQPHLPLLALLLEGMYFAAYNIG